MSTPSFDQLGEAPESDAAHAAWAADIAQQIRVLAEQLREHVEMLEAEVNMSASVTASLTDAAEHLDATAEALANHVTDYASAYEGVRETAEQHGGQIPGMDRSTRYWDETA
jgi:phage host-nuclease inhibitor protein Gam